jgi:hypothetical protein
MDQAPESQFQYPEQNHAAFCALADEMERVKKMEGGIAFICDLLLAVAATQGLALVPAENSAHNLRTALTTGQREPYRRNVAGNGEERKMGIGDRMIAERQREIAVSVTALRMLQAHYGNPYFSFKSVTSAEEQEWMAKAEAIVPPISADD